MSQTSRRPRITVILMIVALTALTGCWSANSYFNYICPACHPPLRPEPIAPTE